MHNSRVVAVNSISQYSIFFIQGSVMKLPVLVQSFDLGTLYSIQEHHLNIYLQALPAIAACLTPKPS